MRRDARPSDGAGADPLDKIKKLVVIAMFSDDELMARLVLKGGNALDLIYHISARASIDVDLSMGADFPGGVGALQTRIERALVTTFLEEDLTVFDVKVEERPEVITEDLAGFWGGYGVEFKLIRADRHHVIGADPEALRREALPIGNAGKFLIDISRHEFTNDKRRVSFEGYTAFVYLLEMMLCEKLRAICQQMPAYGEIVKRGRPGTQRARDFIDLWMLCQREDVVPFSAETRLLLEAIFAAKKVPLALLREVRKFRDSSDWASPR